MAQDLQQPSADSLRLDPFYGTLFIDWSTMPDPSEVSEEDRQGMADLQDLENELIERYWLSVHLDLVSDPEVARTLCHPFDEEFDAFTQLNTTAEAWARKPWTAERKVLNREHYKRLMSLEQEERGQMDWFRHSLRLPGRLQWRNAGSTWTTITRLSGNSIRQVSRFYPCCFEYLWSCARFLVRPSP